VTGIATVRAQSLVLESLSRGINGTRRIQRPTPIRGNIY
jgi:hypothetical protein